MKGSNHWGLPGSRAVFSLAVWWGTLPPLSSKIKQRGKMWNFIATVTLELSTAIKKKKRLPLFFSSKFKSVQAAMRVFHLYFSLSLFLAPLHPPSSLKLRLPARYMAPLLRSFSWLWSAFAFAGVIEFLTASRERVSWKSYSTFGATIIGTKPLRSCRRVCGFTHSGPQKCCAIFFFNVFSFFFLPSCNFRICFKLVWGVCITLKKVKEF